jgi:hypothetical protein
MLCNWCGAATLWSLVIGDGPLSAVSYGKGDLACWKPLSSWIGGQGN